ncbi:putative beta-glucosidase [Helianthus annuus]|uniref:Beta-glucosidase n=1 Tax=Helianthus annuus TaxID=4232 RepID=A0A251T182_HELAN|nr:beta-glucosidase 24 [Helianthus annuus]KAF5776033.1 putative beta-glucosidase [Helianthus annuus]
MAGGNMSDLVHDLDVKRSDFPDDFIFGVGSSAYQIEGGWRADGKGLSIWDSFTLRYPDKMGGANGCRTVDHYSRIKEDVQLLKKMGVNSYRFSISWSRILPGGKVSMGKSMEGINHYNKLIDELLANDIEPFVTLYHWDTPNALEEEYKGFLSSKVVNDFVNYAEICFWEFGDRVKNWVTLNEPYTFIYGGYVEGIFAPGRGGENQDGDSQVEPYIVAYNLLNSHAAAYRLYHENYKSFQKGKVGITLNCKYFEPYRGPSHQQDIQAVDHAYDFVLGWFLEPLTKGSWPESMQRFASTPTPDYPNGRVLPKFSIDQRTNLINSYDFLGINYYCADFARNQHPDDGISHGYSRDCHYKQLVQDPQGNYVGEPSFEGSQFFNCPEQFVEHLVYIKKKYNISKDIVITENGSPDKNDPGLTLEEALDDKFRLNFLKQHLKAIKAARLKNVNVTGYFVWSFMDSFEWSSGYNLRFGMIYVDYKDDLQRYPKKSAVWFRKFLCDNKEVSVKKSDQQGIEVNEHEIEVSQKLKTYTKT